MHRDNLELLLEIFVFVVFEDLFFALNQLLMMTGFNFELRIIIMFIFGDFLLTDIELFLNSLLLYRHWLLLEFVNIYKLFRYCFIKLLY